MAILNTKLRLITSQGVTVSGEFGISKGDEAHLMTILRDTLYSDKVLAVLREYSSNAWDAHNSVGKGTLPIEITLPTIEDQTLYIRDFGPGISQQDIFQVFAQYGASTKRHSNESVGYMGIGGKSAFAYSDSFTVISWNGGMKRTYVAAIDPSERGVIAQLAEEPCGDETGILIQIAVRQDDIPEFEQKAQKLFAYFHPRPKINTEIPTLPTHQLQLKAGVIYDPERVEAQWGRAGDWVAVMGCVSYHIDLRQLTSPKPEEALPDFLSNISGALYFNIGEVQISASREELKYNDNTKKKLVEQFAALIDEYVQTVLQDIEARSGSLWDRRIRSQLLGRLDLPIPKLAQDFTVQHLRFENRPSGLILEDAYGHRATGLSIHEFSRFIVRDNKRVLKGFNLSGHDILVRAKSPVVTPEKLQIALDRYIKKLRVDGISVVKLSSVPRVIKEKGSGRPVNEKYKQRIFQFDGSNYVDGNKKSRHWVIVSRVAQDSDVFVILKKFVPTGYDFYAMHRQDKRLAEAFGGTVPTIYGYKSIKKRPVLEADCKGKSYREWRAGFIKTLLTSTNKELLLKWEWKHLFSIRTETFYDSGKSWMKRLVKNLGAHHQITQIFAKHLSAKKYFRKHPRSDSNLSELHDRAEGLLTESEANKALAGVLARYPLLGATDVSISAVWEPPKSSLWCDYVRMIDELASLKESKNNAAAELHDDQREHLSGARREDPHSTEGVSELQQPPQSNHGGKVGRGAETPNRPEQPGSLGEGEVRTEGGEVPLQRGTDPRLPSQPHRDDGQRGRGSGTDVQVLGASTAQPIHALGRAALAIPGAQGYSAHQGWDVPGLQGRNE